MPSKNTKKGKHQNLNKQNKQNQKSNQQQKPSDSSPSDSDQNQDMSFFSSSWTRSESAPVKKATGTGKYIYISIYNKILHYFNI